MSNYADRKREKKLKRKQSAQDTKARAEKFQRMKKFVQRAVLPIVATAMISYCGTNLYCKSKFDERYAMYVKRLDGTKYMPNSKPSVRFFDYFDRIRRLRSMEGFVDENLGSIGLFVENNKSLLSELSISPTERYGYLERSGAGLQIQEKRTRKDDVIRYISEALNGNFENTDTLVGIMNSDPASLAFESAKEAMAMRAAVETIRVKPRYDKLSQEEKKRFGFTAYASDGTVINQPIDDYEKLYGLSKQLLEIAIKPVTGFIGGSVPLNYDVIRENNVVARWHTHPFNDPNYMPSDPDEANAYIMGPNFLFSQKDGTLHVYSISHGVSKEIYTVSIN